MAVIFDEYGNKICLSCQRRFMTAIGWHYNSVICDACDIYGCPDCVKRIPSRLVSLCKECLEID